MGEHKFDTSRFMHLLVDFMEKEKMIIDNFSFTHSCM